VTLAERILELHKALATAGIPHAFGGAVALAYWTLEPRGTRDIDLNLFVPATEAKPALVALPDAVARDEDTAVAIARDGQVRLWWGNTPIDLFFSYEPLHEEAARNLRMVPFEGEEIPVLGPVELAVFKAMFDRTRDWADIETMVEAQSFDPDEASAWIREMLGEDRRIDQLNAASQRRRSQGEPRPLRAGPDGRVDTSN